jgi:hypothetical protein
MEAMEARDRPQKWLKKREMEAQGDTERGDREMYSFCH